MTFIEPTAAAKGIPALVTLVSKLLSSPGAGLHVHLGQSEVKQHKNCAEKHWQIEKTPIFNDDPAVRMFDVWIVVEFFDCSGQVVDVRSERGYKSIGPRDSKTYEWYDQGVRFNWPDETKAPIGMRVEWTDGLRRWARPYRGKPYRLDGFPGWLRRTWKKIKKSPVSMWRAPAQTGHVSSVPDSVD